MEDDVEAEAPRSLHDPVATQEHRDRVIGREDKCTITDMLATGATYRMIDHWTRCGWLGPPGPITYVGDTPAMVPGSGRRRPWTGREHAIVSLMVRFTRSGIRTSTAARMARNCIDLDIYEVLTDDGVHIAWDPAPPDNGGTP